MAFGRGGGTGRPTSRGAGGSSRNALHQVQQPRRPGLEKLQGLARSRGPAPDVQGQMAALEEQLAGAGPRRGGQEALAALGASFGTPGQATAGAAGRPQSSALAALLQRGQGQPEPQPQMEGLEELLALLGQGGR